MDLFPWYIYQPRVHPPTQLFQFLTPLVLLFLWNCFPKLPSRIKNQFFNRAKKFQEFHCFSMNQHPSIHPTNYTSIELTTHYSSIQQTHQQYPSSLVYSRVTGSRLCCLTDRQMDRQTGTRNDNWGTAKKSISSFRIQTTERDTRQSLSTSHSKTTIDNDSKQKTRAAKKHRKLAIVQLRVKERITSILMSIEL